ncbi:hypothetical protein PR048_001573 [Dryococelus australis]|uniref:Uncharacterized protein n=1 Tax=Dryococelus australis TaxID=614101 RepID=A0ABQ9IJ75_9NEOP|nr:hypothetical protein PR048_001573 [Dryococelus australis]
MAIKISTEVKLDIGAPVSMLLLRIFKKVNNQFQAKTTSVTYINFMFVDVEMVPLLELLGCLALNVVQRANSMASKTAKDNFVPKDKDLLSLSRQDCHKSRSIISMFAPQGGTQHFEKRRLKAELDRLEEKTVIQKVKEIDHEHG